MEVDSIVKAKNFVTTDGRMDFEVVDKSGSNITIKYSDGSIYTIPDSEFMYGISNYNAHCPITFDDTKDILLGRYFKTNSGFVIKIIGVRSLREVDYQFQDEYGYIGTTTMQNIRNGQVKNPFEKNKWGGYIGIGPYNVENNPYIKKYNLYNIWMLMGVRASGIRARDYSHYNNPSQLYINCHICKEWLCFNTWADWYVKSIEKLNPEYTYEMDKDLLYPLYQNQTNGYKLYSPTTISLIPDMLNLTISHYINASNSKSREDIRQRIIFMTENYYATNGISEKTYKAVRSLFYNDGTPRVYIDFRHNNYNTDIVERLDR